jgi:GDP-4-dehydro-6-deoxy-D-mannose reductase
VKLAGTNVLVTGAGGFVGPHLARLLAARGARVHGLGIETPPAGAGLAAFHTADLRDVESLRAAIAASAPTAIVHLAGQSSAALSFEKPVETFEINALGTWNLMTAAKAAAPDARLLIVTSGEIYGPLPEGSRATEQTPIRPVSPYALSKAAADAFAAVASAAGQDVIRARSFGHTGPGQLPRFVVPSMAQQIAAIEAGNSEDIEADKKPRLLVGNLDVTRDLSDVRDVAGAYVALLERGKTGAAYNVCRGEGVRLSDVIARLAALCRVKVAVETDPARLRPADVPYLVGDPALIAGDTGWKPAIGLDQTLRDVLDEWRAGGPKPA